MVDTARLSLAASGHPGPDRAREQPRGETQCWRAHHHHPRPPAASVSHLRRLEKREPRTRRRGSISRARAGEDVWHETRRRVVASALLPLGQEALAEEGDPEHKQPRSRLRGVERHDERDTDDGEHGPEGDAVVSSSSSALLESELLLLLASSQGLPGLDFVVWFMISTVRRGRLLRVRRSRKLTKWVCRWRAWPAFH